MINNVLKLLINAKGELCTSIIVPTHEVSRERRNDKIEIKKAVTQAKEDLKRHANPADFKQLSAKIDDLAGSINYWHNEKGVGIFVSPSVSEVVQFPMPVNEKVTVSNSFEIRDVFYTTTYSTDYYLLVLSEKNVRLFKGNAAVLTEVHSDDFPEKYVDTHEYEKPSRGSSFVSQANVKAFEKDKSIVEDIRLHDFFKTIDKRLSQILKNDTPLIVAAPVEELAIFEEVSTHNKQIAARLHGNFTYKNEAELAEIVFPKYAAYISERNLQLVKDYEESIGYGKGVSGVHAVWQAAREGRGLKLLVEKDYTQEGYLHGTENQLLIKPPVGAHTVIVDAVDDIAETVLEKQGQVYFVDNGILANHGRIAMILRY